MVKIRPEKIAGVFLDIEEYCRMTSEMWEIGEKCRAINKTGVFPQELFTGECGSQRHKCQKSRVMTFLGPIKKTTWWSEYVD